MRTGAWGAASFHCNPFQSLEMYFCSARVNTKTSQSFLRYVHIGVLQEWISKFIPNLHGVRWVFVSPLQEGVTVWVRKIQFSFCSACLGRDFWEARDQFQFRAGSWTASPNPSEVPHATYFPGKTKMDCLCSSAIHPHLKIHCWKCCNFVKISRLHKQRILYPEP